MVKVQFEDGLAAYSQDRKTLEEAIQTLEYTQRKLREEIDRRVPEDRFAWAVQGPGGHWYGSEDFGKAVEIAVETLKDPDAGYRLQKVYLSR